MERINLFYIVVAALGIALFTLFRPDYYQSLSFYGFAESNETDINYNYPIVVDQIYVNPGQAVSTGDTLMRISRRKSKEVLEDQNYRIAELRAEENIWQQNKESDLNQAEVELENQVKVYDQEIASKRQELQYKSELSDGLKILQNTSTSYNATADEIVELETKKSSYLNEQQAKITAIKEELAIGNNPYRVQIERLNAERAFEESQRVIPVAVFAPTDGIIGTISCKEAEHISSYSTLMTFYEPHSGLIHGYVHEDLTLQVQMGDRFEIGSLKNENIRYEGKVIGLGSRIVEIPTRLRKIPEVKTYGREVQLEITQENSFLQKEKVSITTYDEGQ